MKRTYFVAWYKYREMRRPKVAVSGDVDFLPCTCYAPIVRIQAHNKREAERLFRSRYPTL